jgi:MFS family permease
LTRAARQGPSPASAGAPTISSRADRNLPPSLFTPSFASLLLANVFFGYAFSSFFLLPKYMAVALAAGPRDVGAVTAAHGAVIVVTLPFIGAAVDRLGRRAFLTAGALLMAAACTGYAAVHEVGPLLYALRVVQAVAFAMVYASGGALAVDLAPKQRLAQAIGVYGLSFLSMNAVAPAAVEWVAGRVGFEAAFATSALGALSCAALSRRIREPRGGATAEAGAASLVALLRRASTLRVLLVVALVGSAMSAVFAFHQLYALQLGIARVSSFFAAYAATAITVRLGFGHWIDRLGHRRASLVSLAFYALVVLAAARLDLLGLVPLGVGMGLAHGVFYPSFNAVAVGGAGPGESGKVMALYQAAFQSGMAGGGLGFGLLAARAGYPPVFVVAAGGLALALFVLLASPEGRAVRGR